MGDDDSVTMKNEWQGAAEQMAEDHRTGDQPAHTALLHRTFPTYTETMWIHAYPVVRLIIVTCPPVRLTTGVEMPGVVREIPIGPRDLTDATTVRLRFEREVGAYLGMGWQRKGSEIR